MKSFQSVPCKMTTTTTKKLNIKRTQSSMAAAIWIIRVSRTFLSWSVRSITRFVHRIRRAKVVTAKSACKRSWVPSETLVTDRAILPVTTLLRSQVNIAEMEADGKSTQSRWREITLMENTSNQNSSLVRLLITLCRNNLKAVRAVHKLEAHVKVQSKDKACSSITKSAQANSRRTLHQPDSIFSQISSKPNRRLSKTVLQSTPRIILTGVWLRC